MFAFTASALAAYRDDPVQVDLVNTDQTMAGMLRLELVDELRADNPDLPIILCTGFSEFVNAESARERGLGFLTKPVYPDRLHELVAAQLAAPAAT